MTKDIVGASEEAKTKSEVYGRIASWERQVKEQDEMMDIAQRPL